MSSGDIRKDILEAFSCDFKQCIRNVDGLCIGQDTAVCPKNNSQSVYEDLDLLKESK